MALSKKPVTGMKDILPEEMQIRDYVQNVIKETYRSFGFTPIETPCMENIANLTSKQGGENEKLIFKVLKRGEKLNLETAEKEEAAGVSDRRDGSSDSAHICGSVAGREYRRPGRAGKSSSADRGSAGGGDRSGCREERCAGSRG